MRQNPTPPQLPSRWFGGGGDGGGDVYGGHDVDHGHDEDSTNEIFHKQGFYCFFNWTMMIMKVIMIIPL